jgi:hypothetical protein
MRYKANNNIAVFISLQSVVSSGAHVLLCFCLDVSAFFCPSIYKLQDFSVHAFFSNYLSAS